MIPNKQIGWSQEENLLWEVSKQLDRMNSVIGTAPTTTSTSTSTSSTTTTTSTTIAPNLTLRIENGILFYWIDGVEIRQTTLSPGYIGNWTHFCVIRSGVTIYFFQNGIQLNTGVFADAIPTNGLPLYLGSEGNDSVQNGLMSNFRWSDVAVYNEAGFIPPTSPLNATNPSTKLLIFQDNSLERELLDNSGNILPEDIVNATGFYNINNPFGGIEYVGSIEFGATNCNCREIVSVTIPYDFYNCLGVQIVCAGPNPCKETPICIDISQPYSGVIFENSTPICNCNS